MAELARIPELSATVRGVIFDWGGVITTPIVDTVMAWLAADRIDRESYTAAMRPWVREAYGPGQSETPIHALERGEISDAEFEQALAAALVTLDGGPVQAAGLLKRMFAASSVQPDMLALISELRHRGLRTGLLSNSWGTRVSYPYQLLDELFDDAVISGEVGMRKPEERIFRLASMRLGVSPAETIFIDDVEGNITAAKALGFGVVHHTDPASTRVRLIELLSGTAAA
ncbi:MAG TPA: HAD family phosphatase [Streptosporangiaceae bacterium]|nr:HAD family phosphatase [Streptosporangiaceae bacterium]